MERDLKVVASAIYQAGVTFSLPRPARHCDVIRAMTGAGIETPIRGEQGFLLSDGTFANRIKSKAVAHDAGQLREGPTNVCELFSEDVW